MNKKNLRSAVYAGSFDPPTNGHLWMMRKAYEMFDEVTIAIGVNPDKDSTFTVDERIKMLKEILSDQPSINIDAFDQKFLVNYAKSINANFVIRGIRSAADYEYERIMRYINADLQPEISTVLLIPPREFAEVSSTMIKGMIGPEGWEDIIKKYVPVPVYNEIIKRYAK